MYRPDPRLPPDQQMLPTHAKRMMQEQWEREGQTGTVYDRDFRLLNNDAYPVNPTKDRNSPVETANTNTASSPQDESKMDVSPPLPPPTIRSDPGATGSRPGTGGGYKITPTIPAVATFQTIPSPSITPPQNETSPLSAPPPPPPKPQTETKRLSAQNQSPSDRIPRMPAMDEKAEESGKKKGCGCCIVM